MARTLTNGGKRRERSRYRQHALHASPVTTPGAPPGQLRSADSAAGAPAANRRLLSYDASGVIERDATDAWLASTDLRHDGMNDWLDITGAPEPALIDALRAHQGLHPLALEDALNDHQRAKLEDYGEHLFMVLRTLQPGERVARPTQLSLFVLEGLVVTIHLQPEPAVELIRARILEGRGRIRSRGGDYLAYAILDAVVDGYFPWLDKISARLEEVEEQCLTRPAERRLAEIHDIRHELLALRRIVAPLRELTSALLNDPHPLVQTETLPYLRDAQDHARRAFELLEAYREIAASVLDLSLAMLNQRVNESMRLLAVIATVFMPLSWIAGVYGMNFSHELSPYNMPELTWRFGYWWALGVMLLVATALFLVFLRQGWLGGASERRAAERQRDEREALDG
jgi:magnesium transporter